MGDEATLVETNRLLAEFVRLREEDRAEAERFRRETEEVTAKIEADGNRFLTEQLEKRGLPAELAEGTEAEWERRREEATRRTTENMTTLRDRDAEHKAAILAELRVQSDLLRRIAERLEG